MINLENITKIYRRNKIGVFALDHVSLGIKKGEFVAIIGPSGSGKSTLLNIIGCLDRPTEGRYSLEDEDIAKKSSQELSKIRNKKIGFIFQTFNLLPRMDCIRNVELPLLYAGMKRSKRKERAISLLQKVGLGDRMYHKPSELSGGEMQRVAIARALANEPSMILADEPTGNLDSKTGIEIVEIFKELNEKGITFILVTHGVYISSFAQRTIELKDGRIINGST